MPKKMRKISDSVTQWCARYCHIQDDEYPFVVYGIRLLFNTSIKVSLILLIGLVTGHFKEVLIAMSVFGCIRNFAGGYHCKTDIGCFCVMLFICVCPIFFIHIEPQVDRWIWYGISIYAVYEIIRYAPRNSKVNPIYDLKLLKRKRTGSLVVSAVAVIAVLFYPENNLRWLVAVPLFIEAFTLSPFFYRG